ncbi:nicotinate-nucleotide--dimethylbenzimidazole phosphoribosyltransferase [Xanthomonas arboricola]|nr:nicotinate-nucleotide--dimethylbenzimidazole phosphoribosyltransferase [Xanthomonas sp. CFBP 8152]
MTSDWIHGACAVPDARVRAAALARQEQLTKPHGALGRLEQLAVQLAAWQRNEHPTVQRVWIAVYAADHGVAAEGVSAFPQAVTGEMVRNFARGGAAIAVLARELGARLEVVNLGVVNDPGELPRVRRAWIAPASANIC